MSDNKKYIALTLGPIYRTLMLAKSSKELWAASYLFSYLGKELIKGFKERNFVLPYIDEKLYKPAYGAGLFPDRYIFEAQEGDFDNLIKKVDEVIVNLAKDITGNSQIDECTIFLKNYLKIYFLEFGHEDSSTLVETCNRQLSMLELQDNFNSEEKNNFLTNFFEKINGISFLANDAFGNDNTGDNRLFESLIELAIPEHRQWVSKQVALDVDNHEENILKQLKGENKYRSYYRYVAIIKADGDNVGKTISNLQQSGAPVIKLAKQLFEFNLEVVQIVNNYKGKAIYLGGDDLLIFAPLKSGTEQLFSLVEKINKAFEELMTPFDVKPTLSFGISMIHFKSPMFEALEKVDYLLNEKAKKQPGKNAIAFSLQKRSGHHIEAIIPKEQSYIYDTFKEMIDSLLDTPEQTDNKDKVLASVIHWLGRNKEILSVILNQQEHERIKRLSNYFSNSFNEKIHEQYQSFFHRLQTFILNAYKHSNDIDTTIQATYTTLRYVHFLNSDKDE